MIVAIIRGPLGRLVPVAILLLALQTTVLADVRPFGVVLQLMTAFAAAAGVAGGPERGMLAGFVLGLMFDLSTGAPLASSSLTMGFAGLVAGTVTFLNVEVRWWLAAVFVAVGTALGELSVPAVRYIIGQEGVFSDQLYVIVPVVGLGAAVMSPVLVPIGRWCLLIGKVEWKVPHE